MLRQRASELDFGLKPGAPQCMAQPLTPGANQRFKRKTNKRKVLCFGMSDKEERKEKQQHDWNNKATSAAAVSDLASVKWTSKCLNA